MLSPLIYNREWACAAPVPAGKRKGACGAGCKCTPAGTLRLAARDAPLQTFVQQRTRGAALAISALPAGRGATESVLALEGEAPVAGMAVILVGMAPGAGRDSL